MTLKLIQGFLFSVGIYDVQAGGVRGQEETQNHVQNQNQKHPERHTQCNIIDIFYLQYSSLSQPQRSLSRFNCLSVLVVDGFLCS